MAFLIFSHPGQIFLQGLLEISNMTVLAYLVFFCISRKSHFPSWLGIPYLLVRRDRGEQPKTFNSWFTICSHISVATSLLFSWAISSTPQNPPVQLQAADTVAGATPGALPLARKKGTRKTPCQQPHPAVGLSFTVRVILALRVSVTPNRYMPLKHAITQVCCYSC